MSEDFEKFEKKFNIFYWQNETDVI
jgi:hypothetical protein